MSSGSRQNAQLQHSGPTALIATLPVSN